MGERSAAQQRADREARYRKVRDREALEVLPNGLAIVRAMKHEAIDLTTLSRDELIAATDKRSGSKFAATWTLVDYVDWILLVIRVLHWGPGVRPTRHAFRLSEEVGVCKGKAVHTIEVMFDGRNIHAYPAEDR